MHLQSYFPLQNKHNFRHTTNLVSKPGRDVTKALRWKCSIPKKALHQDCSATSQLPKAPVSLGDTNSLFKAKPKSIMHCKIPQGKARNHPKNACEEHTEEHTYTKCNCITTPTCTSHPIPLHLKQKRKHWV